MSKMLQQWWLLWLVVVVLLQPGRSLVPPQCPGLTTNVCYYDSSKVAKLTPNPGSYFAVGGLFDIRQRGTNAYSCGSGFIPSGVVLSQAFLWSLRYWEQQYSGSAVSVGGVVFDSCQREDQLIQNVLGFEQCNLRIENIDRHEVVGFVGPTTNMATMAAASLTEDMDLTIISPTADSVLLSDHDKYPYFLRTTPSMQTDIEVMASVLDHVGTSYVSAIYLQSEKAAFEAFWAKMNSSDICMTASFAMEGDESDGDISAFVRNTLVTLEETRYIALFLSPAFAVRFMDQVSAVDEARTMNLIFLTTAAIRRTSDVFAGRNAVAASNAIVMERREPADVQTAVAQFRGWWTVANLRAVSRISNPFLQEFLTRNNITLGSQLPAIGPEVANTFMATKAFVEGTRQAGINICQNTNAFLCSSFFDVSSRGSTINQNIRSASGYFTPLASSGLYQNGDLRADRIDYDVFRYLPSGQFVKIGDYMNGALQRILSIRGEGAYNPGQCPDSPCLQCGEEPTTTTTTTTLAPATRATVCQPDNADNFSMVYYPPDQEITGAYMQGRRGNDEYGTRFDIRQRWIIALGVLAGLGILAVIIFEIYILYKLLGTRMGQKWRTMWLGQLLLFGIFLCYLTLFAYLFVPTKATCGITRFGVGVSYSVCFAVLLVKLMVILTSKSSDNSLLPGDVESPNYLKGIYQFLMFVFVVGVQVVIDAQWLITIPPDAVKVTSNSGSEVWVCNHYTFRASSSMSAMTDMSSFVRSEFENHVLSLVYIMFLILITTLLALSAHGIITNHRESVFIGIASGFSIPIWLAWTLVGGLNKDHDYAHEFGDACIAFGLFLTATLILFAMFLPKVRQLVSMGVEGIYFEDDRDTVYAGSVVMAPPSYKSHPNSVIYVNNQGIYSEPVVLGNGDSANYMRHSGSGHPTPASTYSAPPTYLKRGADSTIKGGSVLRVTDDLSGRRPVDKRRPMSEVAYGTVTRPRSLRGTLPKSRSYSNLGAL